MAAETRSSQAPTSDRSLLLFDGTCRAPGLYIRHIPHPVFKHRACWRSNQLEGVPSQVTCNNRRSNLRLRRKVCRVTCRNRSAALRLQGRFAEPSFSAFLPPMIRGLGSVTFLVLSHRRRARARLVTLSSSPSCNVL